MTFKDYIRSGVYISVKPDQETINKLLQIQKRYDLEPLYDFHCTLIYSNKPSDISLGSELVDYIGTSKQISVFGQDQKYLVLELNSDDLTKRNKELTKRYDFISDFDEYRPHITLGKIEDEETKIQKEIEKFNLSFNIETVERLIP